jgi:hypothetical protein
MWAYADRGGLNTQQHLSNMAWTLRKKPMDADNAVKSCWRASSIISPEIQLYTA